MFCSASNDDLWLRENGEQYDKTIIKSGSDKGNVNKTNSLYVCKGKFDKTKLFKRFVFFLVFCLVHMHTKG